MLTRSVWICQAVKIHSLRLMRFTKVLWQLHYSIRLFCNTNTCTSVQQWCINNNSNNKNWFQKHIFSVSCRALLWFNVLVLKQTYGRSFVWQLTTRGPQISFVVRSFLRTDLIVVVVAIFTSYLLWLHLTWRVLDDCESQPEMMDEKCSVFESAGAEHTVLSLSSYVNNWKGRVAWSEPESHISSFIFY